MATLSAIRYPSTLSLDRLHLGDYSNMTSQSTESQHITQIFQALQALQDENPGLFESFGSSPILHIENILCLLDELQQPIDPVKVKNLKTAWEAYSQYLDAFVDSTDPSQTTFKYHQEAQEQAKNAGYKDIQLNTRALYFKSSLQKEYLAQPPETEEGAYARVLDTREKLRLILQHVKPEISINAQLLEVHSLDIKALSENPEIQLLLKSKMEAYQHAVDLHATFVKSWGETQTGTIRTLYEKTLPKREEEEGFIWEGRAAVLKHRVDQLDAFIKKGFLNLYTDYQQRIRETSDDLKGRVRRIDPGLIGESRLGNSTWKLCQFFTWIFNHLSRWKNGVSTYGPLMHQYHLLQSETTKKMPTKTAEIDLWMKGKPQIEETFTDKGSFHTLKQNYLKKAETLLTRLDEEAVDTTNATSQNVEASSRPQQTLPTEMTLKLLKNLILLNGSEVGVDFFAKVICDYDQIEKAEIEVNSASSHTFTIHYNYSEEEAIRETSFTVDNCKIPFFNRSYALRIKYPKVLQFTIDSEERTINFNQGNMIEICPMQPAQTEDIFLQKVTLNDDEWIQLELQAEKSEEDHRIGLARALKSYITPDQPVWIDDETLQSIGKDLDTWTYQNPTPSTSQR